MYKQQMARQNRLADRQESKWTQEEAIGKMKVLGPEAMAVLSSGNPEAAYMESTKRIQQMFPEFAGKAILTFQQAMPHLQQIAKAYQIMSQKEQQPYTLGPDQVRFGADNKEIARGVPKPEKETPTELAKLIKERNSLPDDDPNRAAYDAVIASKGQKQGLTIETEPDGSTRIVQGPIGQAQTPGRKKVDQEFATKYVKFKATGGFADIGKQLSALDQVVSKLESGEKVSGPIIGLMPDAALYFTNPEAVNTREAIEEVVQRNLKVVLGGQFTEREGEKLVKRAYNPSLGEKENARRVRRLVEQISIAAKATESAGNYFEEHGTLTGWKGKMPTLDDFRNIDFDRPLSSENKNGRTVTVRNPQTGEDETWDLDAEKRIK
jgi:hypothetical protein